MQKRKIAILGFGGTIAMVSDNGVLKPAKSIDEILQIVPTLGEMAEVTLQQVENIDSTNLNPSHWTKLSVIVAGLQDTCDGIIITHGTDTMAYTASAVSLALGRGLRVPVVFTGSQLPLVYHGTDARFNLENSMRTLLAALDRQVVEVMICFSDRVLRAGRAIKVSESKFLAFDSPALPHLAMITAVGIAFQPHANTVDRLSETSSQPRLDLQPHFMRGIVTLDLVPGQEPGIIRAILESGRCQGILLMSLGAGNVPSEGDYSLIPVIREATLKFKVPVLVSTKFVGGQTHMETYEPGKLALDAGAIPTGDTTGVMAQVKLMWALAQGYRDHDDLLRVMNTSYAGEVTPA